MKAKKALKAVFVSVLIYFMCFGSFCCRAYEPKESEVDALGDFIFAVCEGRDYFTMLCVGSVVVNRVESSAFSDDIFTVISRMTPPEKTVNEKIHDFFFPRNKASVMENCRRAAYEVLNGVNPVGNILYISTSQSKSRALYKTPPAVVSGGLEFYVG